MSKQDIIVYIKKETAQLFQPKQVFENSTKLNSEINSFVDKNGFKADRDGNKIVCNRYG